MAEARAIRRSFTENAVVGLMRERLLGNRSAEFRRFLKTRPNDRSIDKAGRECRGEGAGPE